ncbi:SDR family NAD(P)-dependent oxidoreductase [Burkholderia sp. Ac-20365]|uniref:SDR family NAD(P)-dependent oxidoreductase n=1 Tax=Burkholderia sp. Ac-20365 TaxID=2703897 RepID=UPI00197CA10E|nr:SDR family NAD(P)-dependent oxidoreductase [Burkholderia sp. Ac-20365]MBN3766163.1 SDR family oxidoreductase [Burkholderia sp. Ac-20365]
MNISFEGQVVAVSGAAIGFGRVIATTFAALGARVFACDIRADELNTLAAPNIDTQVVDLLDRERAAAWIRHVETQGGKAIDVLVNNAGGVACQAPRPIDEVTDAQWDRVIEINLGTTFSLSRAAAPAMKRAGRGSIVNISSGAALQASLTGVQAYCSAKHAVLGLTRQLAHELGPHGIRVNSVAPGFVRTNEATEKQWAAMGEARQRTLLDGIALRRFGTPEDITRAVLFFASELSAFVNGQILSVDGGR